MLPIFVGISTEDKRAHVRVFILQKGCMHWILIVGLLSIYYVPDTVLHKILSKSLESIVLFLLPFYRCRNSK